MTIKNDKPKRSGLERVRIGYIRFLETLEDMALSTVARIVPWLIPIAPAWAIKTSVEQYLHVDPIIALLMALAFEGMGIYVTHVAFTSWTWNKTKNQSDPNAPFALMAMLVGVYILVGGLLVLVIKLYPPATVIAPAAFLPLGLVVYTAWANHMQLSGWIAKKSDQELLREQRTGIKGEIKTLIEQRKKLEEAVAKLANLRDEAAAKYDQYVADLTAKYEAASSQFESQIAQLRGQRDGLASEVARLQQDLATSQTKMRVASQAERPKILPLRSQNDASPVSKSDEIAQRRERIYSHLADGRSRTEIAEAEGISLDTVRRDIDQLRSQGRVDESDKIIQIKLNGYHQN